MRRQAKRPAGRQAGRLRPAPGGRLRTGSAGRSRANPAGLSRTNSAGRIRKGPAGSRPGSSRLSVRPKAAAPGKDRSSSFPIALWSRRAFRAGRLDAREALERTAVSPPSASEAAPGRAAGGRVTGGRITGGHVTGGRVTGPWKRTMNELWNRWLERRLNGFALSERHYAALAAQYARGFAAGSGVPCDRVVLLPTTRSVAAVVTAMNEERTLPVVLDQLERLPLHETIVVINGSTDNSYHIARSRPEVTILHYPEPLGHDVGRAVGAKASTSDIVLFLDGDLPVEAEQLRPFIAEIARGGDVALNDIHRYIGVFSERDVVTVMKEFLNRVLGREDLGASSLTAIPHAMSREAIRRIGYESLAVPPLAHARAIRLGLKLGRPVSVDVITRNKVRRSLNVGVSNPVAEMIIGDHIEALHDCMREAGSRLGFHDRTRNRQAIGRRAESG